MRRIAVVRVITGDAVARDRRSARLCILSAFAMFIVYGSRYYGLIDHRAGQCQLTRFAHVYWLPLFPIGTMWVTGTVNDGYQGHTVGWSARSVLAGYARTWGPIVAVLAGAQLSLTGILIAIIAAAITAWTWTWFALHSAREQRRSDCHFDTYGTRCDPLRMPRQLAYSLRTEIDRRWAEAAAGRPPGDLAPLGAADAAQAALAYATQRLAARTSLGERSRHARQVSEKLLDLIDRPGPAPLFGAPYRAEAVAAVSAVPTVVEGTRMEPPAL